MFEIKGKRLTRYFGSSYDVVIPEGVSIIGLGVFAKYGFMRSVRLPDGVIAIERGAFADCERMESISIPDTLQRIVDMAFIRCRKLTEIRIPHGTHTVSDSAFYECTALEKFCVDTKNTVYKDIDGVLFTADGKELIAYPLGRKAEKYTVPDGVKRIHKKAFAGCVHLNEVVVPEGVEVIEESAFFGCEWLRSVYLPSTLKCNINTVFGYALQDGYKVPELIFYDARRCKGLDDDILASIVRGYFYRLERNALSEDELCGFIEFVKHRLFRLLDIFSGDVRFYKFITGYGILNTSMFDRVLENTESLECRAVLLDHRNRSANKEKGEEIL